MKRKKLAALSAGIVLVLALVLSACASTGTTPTTPAAPAGPLLISISASTDLVELDVNDTEQLEIIATFDDGSKQDVTSTCAFFGSDNPKVATVTSGGLITGVGKGTANITVAYTKGAMTDTINIPVHVV